MLGKLYIPHLRTIKIHGKNSGKILQKIVESGKCFQDHQGYFPFRWDEPKRGVLTWEWNPESNTQKLVLGFGEERVPGQLQLNTSPPCYYDEDNRIIGWLESDIDPKKLQKLLKAPPIKNEDVAIIHKKIAAKMKEVEHIAPKIIKEIVVDEEPTPLIRLYIVDIQYQVVPWATATLRKAIGLTLYANYGGHLVRCEPPSKWGKAVQHFTNNQDSVVKLTRNYDHEGDFFRILLGEWEESRFLNSEKCQFILNTGGNILDEIEMVEAAYHLVENFIPAATKDGWTVELDESFPIQSVKDAEEWFLDVEDSPNAVGNDWFDVKLGVMIDGERVNILPHLITFIRGIEKQAGWDKFEALDGNATVGVPAGNKTIVKVPVKRIRNIAEHLMLECSESDGKENLKVSKWNATFLNEFAQGEAAAKSRWIGPENLKNFLATLEKGNDADNLVLPSTLLCELRHYQKQGVQWLQMLSQSNLNGILADDMGLGKTVQTLAHILIEKESGRMTHPTIIIAPTSLMPNWASEAEKFTPSLKVLVLHGNERKMHFSTINEFDIVLTTYPLLMRDKEFLLQHEFHIVVMDEAQVVKNFKTQAYQVIQQIKANQRICLSGTPMENHLGELWSLFHLLLPGFLGNQKTFQQVFRKPIEQLKNVSRREALAKRIKPFILRRTKQQVAIELPDKTEITQKIELKASQRDLYEAIRLRAQAQVMQEINKKGLNRSQIMVLDALLKLRQVCCDPRLVKVDSAKNVEESAKLEHLMEMVTQMIEEGRKILIFSQFTSMLDLIGPELDKSKIEYSTIRGDTKDRKTPVEQFQGGKVPLMLISLKAGGVGLNLTAADTVIHYDPWWNPAVENQATDRAHRIGQKKAVFVYKLIIAGSLEEKILDMQKRKKGLADAMLDSNVKMGEMLTMEDLQDIFKPLPKEGT
jgi:superfamily II DNA or RNA helicase